MKSILRISIISTIGLLFVFFISCKKDEKASATDVELYNMAKETADFVWYKNSDALLPRSDLSGHSETYLRTRYNSIAAAMLDGAGKVQSAIVFPEGSIIVKELRNSIASISKYAILYKESAHKYADSDGWVWGYLKADGTVAEPSSNKGSACRACHNHAGNVDHTLMNVAFP